MASSDGKGGVWVLGVTGASGIRYAVRLLNLMSVHCAEVHCVFSDAALRVLHDEEGIKASPSSLSAETLTGKRADNVIFHNARDIGAPIASGSFRTDGMVIVPCSMGTLGALAHGIPAHLVHRAADVTLKEGRKLIVVPRETPLSSVHLENMLVLARAGVAIIPAMPGFYHRPRTLDDIVDMMVMKILDRMGIPLNLVERWGQRNEVAEDR